METNVSSLNTSGFDPINLVPATSWQRYWARSFDLGFSAILAAVMLAALFPAWWEPDGWVGRDTSGYAGGLVFIFVGLFIDAAIYSIFGVTPGKWISGIRVLHIENRRLQFVEYIKRNLKVWLFGLAAGLPLISLFTLMNAKSDADDMAKGASWDRSCASRVYSVAKPTHVVWRQIATAIAYVLVTALMFYFGSRSSEGGSQGAVARSIETYEEQMRREAASVGVQQIDDYTRMDGAEFGPDNRLEFRYTLITSDISMLSEDDIDRYLTETKTELRKSTCKEMREWVVDKGTTIGYRYSDMNNRHIGTIDVITADCI